MCIVSAVGDYFKDGLPERHPWVQPYVNPDTVKPTDWPKWPILPQPDAPSKAEFDKLKAEVEALKELLLAAKKFDEKTGQPHCELDAKIDLIKKIAAFVGVDVSDVFDKPKKAKRDAKRTAVRSRRRAAARKQPKGK